MLKEVKDCYGNSARNFVRVVVDTETKVLYLTNKKTMIPMLSKDGTPSLFSDSIRIINLDEKVRELNGFVGWQNIFVNEEDKTMYVGGTEILCQLIDEKGSPKIFEDNKE